MTSATSLFSAGQTGFNHGQSGTLWHGLWGHWLTRLWVCGFYQELSMHRGLPDTGWGSETP